MIELFRMIRVIGPSRLLTLLRAYRLGWKANISGYYTTRIMQALFNVGFFDEMQRSGSVDAKEFAAANGIDETILQSLCECLYALSILNRNGAGYVLDSKGHVLVEVARGWFDGVYGYEEIFHALESLLRKEKVYGEDIHRRPEYVARGSGQMEKWLYFPLAKDIIRGNNHKKVLDLGCGEATFLRHLCANSANLIGYGVDIAPEAIEEGRRKVEQAGLQDRIQLDVEDITQLEEVPKQWREVDVATTFFVLHEILFAGPEPVVELLRSFRRLFPDTPLLVFEVIRPTSEELRKRPGIGAHYFLQHDLSHQKPVGIEEWRKLFSMAGFESIDERYSSFARSAIFTLR